MYLLRGGFLFFSIGLAIVTVLYFVVATQFSYIDPGGPCWVKTVTDVVEGNNRLVDGIKKLKESDPYAYKDLCQHVDTIVELNCIAGDPRVNLDPKLIDFEYKGCFIKGSKTVYLLPNKDGTQQDPTSIATTLKKYTQVSREYWASQSN